VRTAVVLLVVLAFASVASSNPSPLWPGVFIDFDEDGIPDSDIHTSVYPAPYVTLSAYLALSCNDQPGEEFASISFALNDFMATCPGVFAPPTFTNLLPGDLAIGNVYTGITLASTECLTAPIVYFGRLDLFYLGGACEIQILDHPQWPRWVVDCNSDVYYYGVASYGGVGMEPEFIGEGEMDCLIVAVEDITWGVIKSMYR